MCYILSLNSGAVGDEDNYGLEMEAYLNEEDIIKPQESRQGGILKFCTPNAAVRTSKPNDRKPDLEGSKRVQNTRDRKQGEGKKPRKIDALPSFSSDEDFDNGSDDDLPEVDLDGKRKNFRLVDGAMDTEEDSLSSNRKDATEVESETTTSDNNSREVLLEGLNKWKKKRRKRVKSEEQDAKGIQNGKLTKDAQSEMLNKERESNYFEGPFIEIIPNNDLDEFDDPVAVERHGLDEIQTPAVKLFDRGINTALDGSSSGNGDVVFNDSRNEFEEVMPNYEMFPVYTSESALSQYVSPKKVHTKGSRTRVQTPPSPDDVVETMTYMAVKDRLSPVNVLDLVDKWEKEKDNEASIPSPPALYMLTGNEVRSTSSRMSISDTSIRINMTSNNCQIVSRNSTAQRDTDSLSKDGAKVPDALPAVDVSFDREMNAVYDLQNFMADKSPARSATSASVNTTTESDDVQSLGSMVMKLQSDTVETTSNHNARDGSNTGLKAKCEEFQLDDSINERNGKSRHDKSIEAISICSKESDKEIVSDTQNVNHGDTESAVGCSTDMKQGRAGTEAVMDCIRKKSEELFKEKEMKQGRAGTDAAMDYVRKMSEKLSKEKEAKKRNDLVFEKNDQRCQPNGSDSDQVEVLEMKQDDSKDVVSVYSESSGASTDRRNQQLKKSPLNVPLDNSLDDLDNKSVKSSQSTLSNDSVSILAPTDISSVQSVAGDELNAPQLGCISTPVPWSKQKPQPSVKTPSDFSFDDGIDDSVFADIRTPFSVKTTPNHTPTQTSPRPGDTSQITFTQALAVVHDSSHSEGSQGFEQGFSPRPNQSSIESTSDESVSPVFITQSASSNTALLRVEIKKGQTNSTKDYSFDDALSRLIEDTGSRSATSITESSKISDCSHADAPQFDLGFDFSDPEDDDVHVIPPSPPARTGTQPFSQRPIKSLSNTSLPVIKSVVQEVEKIVEREDEKVSDVELGEEYQSLSLGTGEEANENSRVVRAEQKLTRKLSKHVINEHDDLQKKNVESPSALQSREQNYFISNQISSQIKQNSDPPVAVVAPTLSVPTDQDSLLSRDITDIKSNKSNSSSDRSDYTCDFQVLDDDDFLEEILETERRETKQTEQSIATKDSFVGQPFNNQAEIETIDPNEFDIDESGDQECTEAKKDVVADVESDSSDSGKGSPFLTLSNKRSKYSSFNLISLYFGFPSATLHVANAET